MVAKIESVGISTAIGDSCLAIDITCVPDFDELFLHRVMRDVNRHAFGVVAADVYVLRDESLSRPAGGWWSSSVFVPKSLLERRSRVRASALSTARAPYSSVARPEQYAQCAGRFRPPFGV